MQERKGKAFKAGGARREKSFPFQIRIRTRKGRILSPLSVSPGHVFVFLAKTIFPSSPATIERSSEKKKLSFFLLFSVYFCTLNMINLSLSVLIDMPDQTPEP